MRRFLMNAFEARTAIIAGYNGSSVELCKRLKDNPGMRLECAGFFDDRSTERLGMDPDTEAQLLGPLADLGTYVKEHGTDVIFIALPIRHVKRVMNLLDDLRDTTGLDLLRAGHLRVRPDPGALGRDPRDSGGRDVRDAVLRLSRRRPSGSPTSCCRSQSC